MPKHLADDERLLWEAYKADPTDERRNALYERYHSFIRARLAQLCTRRGLSRRFPDLLSTVQLRILTSTIPRFSPWAGKPFLGFAESAIAGAVLDELRRIDRVRRKARAFEKKRLDAVEDLQKELDHAPTLSEVAYYMGVSEQELEDQAIVDVISINSDSRSAVAEALQAASDAPGAAFADDEQLDRLSHGIPLEQKCLLWLRFRMGMSNLEIRDRVYHRERSSSRISQLITDALRRMAALNASEETAEL